MLEREDLAELEKENMILTSQLSGKEDIHSMDKMTTMSTDYARLSLKTQNQLRSAVANLPSDIQSRIFRSKAMTESCDQWFRHFEIMVTSHFPVPESPKKAFFFFSFLFQIKMYFIQISNIALVLFNLDQIGLNWPN